MYTSNMSMTLNTQVAGVVEARSKLGQLIDLVSSDAGTVIQLGSHRKAKAALVNLDLLKELSHDVLSLENITSRKELIELAARSCQIERVELIGSVQRGDHTDSSDIDFLVTPGADASGFDLVRFSDLMEKLFGRSIDVVSSKSKSWLMNPSESTLVF